MKKLITKTASLILSLLFALSAVSFVSGAAAENSAFYILPEDNDGLSFAVGSYDKTGSTSYLCLPNTVDASRVVVRYGGSYSSVTGDTLIEWNSSAKTITVDATNECSIRVGSKTLTFMRSSLPAMSITLNEGESLDTINSDKEAKIGAAVSITGTGNAKYELPSTAIQMKTRGNTTFWPDKKPYQIKFDKKTDLFGMGKAKKWILLANYYDGTMIRTKVFFDLAKEIGMDDAPDSVFVDLYIDGDYRGVYQLTEKIEIGSARLDLKDEKGVVIEMESSQRIGEETDPYFITTRTRKPFVYKDYVTDFEDTSTAENRAKIAEVKTFVQNYINTFETVLYSKDRDWDTLSSMIDVDSFILYYFVNEYGEQVDCTLASTYFYIDGPDDVLHCGPVWDFDRVCGFNDPVPKNTDYVKNITDNVDQYRVEWFKELFRYPEFVKRANELYTERIKDAFDTDKVNATIDSLQTALMPSLKMNHLKWVVFYDRCYTADELASGGTEALIAYTTDAVKTVLTDKKAYMDTTYGKYVPTISYTTYGTNGVAAKNYTGGCITYEATVAGLSIELFDNLIDGGIEYRVNVDGAISETASNGEIAKSAGGFAKANAIYVDLTGNIANYYSVQYRVRLGGNRWSPWVTDGKIAGRSSSSNGTYLIDRMQMRIIQKAELKFATVNFIAEGLDTVTESVVVGNAYGAPAAPEKPGFEFTGWYTNAACTEPFADGAVASEEKTYNVYAGFVRTAGTPGDANGDGMLTIKDLASIKTVLAGISDYSGYAVENCDVNEDGLLNLKDLADIKKLLA